jgi:hypothetical protein
VPDPDPPYSLNHFMNRTATTGLLILIASLAGCGLQKGTAPAQVLTTQDFIGDATTIPTETGPASPSAPPTVVVSSAVASGGVVSVTAVPGGPSLDGEPAAASASPVLIDAKVGELNGRPVRASVELDQLGNELGNAARKRELTRDQWNDVTGGSRTVPPGIENRAITREEWYRFAQLRFVQKLNRDLADQLLAEEARASLKPEQRQGLKYIVEEASEQARREAGGSRAAVQQQLRDAGSSESEKRRKTEAELLVGYELSEKLRKRIRTSWRDVRLYYDQNPEEFNPPPVATFRIIQVPAAKPEAVAAVQAALDAGTPFAQVAAMPENTYNARDGGRAEPRTVRGEFSRESFFAGSLGEVARTLTEGQFNKEPVDFGSDKSWVYLDRIESRARPLADADVQLLIANRLNAQALDAEYRAYINRLKTRATFTDIPSMATKLADIAAARYWPEP